MFEKLKQKASAMSAADWHELYLLQYCEGSYRCADSWDDIAYANFINLFMQDFPTFCIIYIEQQQITRKL